MKDRAAQTRAYVYIMTNRSRTLYTGVARDLMVRAWEHKKGVHPGSFTSRYKCDRLVYFERFASIIGAINREKQIKGMTRKKKMQLIVSMNPEWRDLSEGWGGLYRPGEMRAKSRNA